MATTFSRRKLLTSSGLIASAAALDALPSPVLAQGHSSQSANGLIRLVANENPYGPGPAARQVLKTAIDDSWKYAFRQEGRLKELVAEREGVEPRQWLRARAKF